MPPSNPILYSSVTSPHCFKVSLVLAEKGVEFDRVEVDLRAKEQRTPDYLAINPLGQVPVYRDDRGVHIDSLVIMRYLDERYPTPTLFPEDGEPLRLVLDWIECSSTVMRDVSHHLYWQLLEPPASGADAELVDRLRRQGLDVLDRVERALVAGRGWLVGDAMTAADISCFAWLYGYRRFELPPTWDAHPNVRAWLETLERRPSFAAAYRRTGRPFRSLQIEGEDASA